MPMRNVLLIAFNFPPLTGSSGIQRTLRFAQYLPQFGWNPIVLTVSASAYERSDPDSVSQIPPGCEVVRVPCLDTARHLSFRGRYLERLSLPDRWASWTWLGARMGARVCARRDVAAIWSTYPIASAHRLGALVAARTGLPWVADFRDPMAQDDYPPEPARWQAFQRIESAAAQQAARLVFVTASALQTYRTRYAQLPPERFALLENGYDEAVFEQAGALARSPRTGGPLVLLHSGIVYPSERDPTFLFEALGALKRAGRIEPGEFVIRFRAAVHDDLLSSLAKANGVSEFIEIAPAIPYVQAIAEMLEVDGLLAMQGRNCNDQVPAKLYEYFRAGRPILGLADPHGDTGRAMLGAGVKSVCALEEAADIGTTLRGFLDAVRGGAVTPVDSQLVSRFSRRALTGRLAAILDEVSA